MSKFCQNFVKILSKECQNPVKRNGEAKQTLSKLLSFFDISLYLLSRLRLGFCIMRGFTHLTLHTTYPGTRFPHTSISTYLFIYIYMQPTIFVSTYLLIFLSTNLLIYGYVKFLSKQKKQDASFPSTPYTFVSLYYYSTI